MWGSKHTHTKTKTVVKKANYLHPVNIRRQKKINCSKQMHILCKSLETNFLHTQLKYEGEGVQNKLYTSG